MSMSWQHVYTVAIVLIVFITSHLFTYISATTTLSTIAGGTNGYINDALGTNARFGYINGIDYLNIEGTQLLIGDYDNAGIRHIDLSNNAATTMWAGVQSQPNTLDQTSGTDFTTGTARFQYIQDVRVLHPLDISTPTKPVVVYVASQVTTTSGIRRLRYTPSDSNSYEVKSIDTTGLGSVNGPFYKAYSVAMDRHNDVVYAFCTNAVADRGIMIRITSASTTATPSVIMEIPLIYDTGANGVEGTATFNSFQSMTVNTAQAATSTTPDLYITDGYVIRRLTTDATPTLYTVSGSTGGYVEGEGTNAKWTSPAGIQFFPTSATAAVMYVADFSDNIVRQIVYDVTGGTYTTSLAAGTRGIGSHQDATPGKFYSPTNLAFYAPTGAMYVVESAAGKSYVRQVTGLSSIAYIPPTSPPAGVSGDPQFVGLHGQVYQVHGTPGEVFNLITSPQLQINSLFSYLDDTRIKTMTRCNKHVDTCHTHPGTYLTSLGINIWPEGQSQPTSITVTIQLNNQTDWEMHMMTSDNNILQVNDGDTYIIKDGSLKWSDNTTDDDTHNYIRIDTHRFTVHVCHHLSVTFTLSPDGFFNAAISVLQHDLLAAGAHRQRISGMHDTSDPPAYPSYPLHGLIGQTWKNVEYITSTGKRYYEGMIDDYLIQDGSLLGTEFAYNQFPSSD